MKITYAEEKDIAAIAAAEAACFPPAEAATEQEFVERIKYYGNHFWLLYDADKLIAFVDGFVTDEPDLTDAMYENACRSGNRAGICRADQVLRQPLLAAV